MTERTPIRVLLADDHPLVLEGISSRLGTETHLDVVGLAHNGLEALELAAPPLAPLPVPALCKKVR
jgi:DNA-binding NarL/FixJ family response regulator